MQLAENSDVIEIATRGGGGGGGGGGGRGGRGGGGLKGSLATVLVHALAYTFMIYCLCRVPLCSSN